MNLVDCLKLQRPFKRKDWSDFVEPDSSHEFDTEDMVADDWECQEESISLTRSQFEDHVRNAQKGLDVCAELEEFEKRLRKYLGFAA